MYRLLGVSTEFGFDKSRRTGVGFLDASMEREGSMRREGGTDQSKKWHMVYNTSTCEPRNKKTTTSVDSEATFWSVKMII